MSDTEQMTITEFLEARIADDEDELNRTFPEWAKTDFSYGGTDDYEQFTMGYGRVLAECAAKRAIAERHRPDRQLENWYWSQRKCAECGGTWHKWLNNDVPTDIGPAQGCHTLRALAAVYKDHPDYQQDWE